ncbi:DNA invertase Pin-like site-specific DNA recombinase [Micrococcus cohnii]|uniref:DNA invertase Pin-like site-specific DNA recombinase n=1 Tax=Micrococcus cohnii TaxID=993416 RepID=A0A7W7M2B2_9MICC|nr:DNA invertase Pin-like site-specific DNA recombinase [Micrococcus cohnii]
MLGYARVSTRDQETSLRAQEETLLDAGAERVFKDEVSGMRSDRPGLAAALDWARDGDVLVVTRLDRLGRSTLDTLHTVRELDGRGVRVKAPDIDLDTSTPAGRLVMRTLVSLAEWERDVPVECTKEGLAHARAHGRVGGRPRVLSETDQAAIIAALEAGVSRADVARLHGVSPSHRGRSRGSRQASTAPVTSRRWRTKRRHHAEHRDFVR